MRQSDPVINKAIWIFVFASMILTPIGGIILVSLYLLRSGYIKKDSFKNINTSNIGTLKSDKYDTKPKQYQPKQYANPQDFYSDVQGLSPEELIELDKASHDEFSHNIYHEINKTVHNSNGIFLIYNATKKEYYLGKSNDTIRRVCRLLQAKSGILSNAYRNGDALRIKIMCADGRTFINNEALILDVKSKYPVIII